MPRYFLHVRTSKGLVPDRTGVELKHLGRLRDSMTKVARDLVRDDPTATKWSFEVADEAGRIVFTEELGALVKPADDAKSSS